MGTEKRVCRLIAFIFIFIFTFSGLCFFAPVYASEEITQIDLVFDSSNSMWGQIDGKPKIDIAREALNDLLGEFEKKENFYLGLRIYGHLNKRCDNSVLEIKPGKNNSKAIKEKIAGIKPLGKTPIAYSLQLSEKDFDYDLKGKKIIILLTDGLESCEGDPCEVARILQKAGIVTKIHVVGFDLKDSDLNSLRCIVKPSGGMMIGARNTAELKKAFKEISKSVSLENNLHIKGMDKNKTAVSMNIKILENEKLVTESMGSDLKFTLKANSYSVSAESCATGQILTKGNITVSQEKVSYVEFEFSQGFLDLKSLDGTGKQIYSSYKIKQSDKVAATVEGKERTLKAVLPGIYEIEATDSVLHKTIVKKDIQVKEGLKQEVVFNFSDAVLELSSIDGEKSELYVSYTVTDALSGKLVAQNEGKGKLRIPVSPGHYNIKANFSDSNVELIEKDIAIEMGQSHKKEFVFAQCNVVLNAVDSEGNAVYSCFEVLKSGTEEILKADEGSDKVTIILSPGIYDIKAYNSESKAVLWEKEINVNGGESLEKQFVFAQCKAVLNAVDSKGNSVYANFQVLKSGTGEEIRTDEGSGKVTIILSPGIFDIQVYNYDSKASILEKEIEIKAGESFERQFVFK
ncbi:MAG: hypothetical protein CVV64_18600 [Candidatus Wallbacteria bacterium HGW-Wallbacteria-1]|jgi:Ca-activated chloride channel family protein|uniref:VWFA domain-containing protein n=1 Tax=Candidatus Wallbacteria bacterium HGW-Wallbacteria-1 TaxID=2013854 RepID=A0A2N1PJD9_9BACT|nr:MAG: hypothetical protein CVV64_18600 [Candidatus Wallbacteria bacterium HGW-Wallbacteria-1]